MHRHHAARTFAFTRRWRGLFERPCRRSSPPNDDMEFNAMQARTVPSAAAAPRQVYQFGPNRTDGSADLKALLGGKGANLAEMAALGLPVPPGFTITTEVCNAYYANGNVMPPNLAGEVYAALAEVGTA